MGSSRLHVLLHMCQFVFNLFATLWVTKKGERFPIETLKDRDAAQEVVCVQSRREVVL